MDVRRACELNNAEAVASTFGDLREQRIMGAAPRDAPLSGYPCSEYSFES
jgi:hypothetical protein